MADQDAPSEQVIMSRRALVRTVGLGAVALTATHVGVAYGATQLAQEPLQAKNQELTTEVERLQGLVALYESLDKVGVDTIVGTGLATVKGLLEATRSGLLTLSSGVTAIETLLGNFSKTFAVLREGLRVVEGIVQTVSKLLGDVQRFLSAVTSPVKPLALQLRDFFGLLPFIGENIRQGLDSFINLIAELPNLILMLNTQLLEPLRATWLSDQAGQNVQTALVDPLIKNVLEPAKAQLKNFDQVLARWETDYRAPVQAALDQRATIRKQITDYRKQYNLTS